MYTSTILAALIAVVSATPLDLVNRGASTSVIATTLCSSLATTTTLSNTLTGPFRMQVSATSATINGNYAKATPGGKVRYPKVLGPSFATDFYLNQAGHLNIISNNKLYTTYEYSPTSGNGAVLTNSNTNTNFVCSIASSCALECKAGPGLENSYQVLLSPKDQPDWYVAANQSVVPKNAVPFTPYVQKA